MELSFELFLPPEQIRSWQTLLLSQALWEQSFLFPAQELFFDSEVSIVKMWESMKILKVQNSWVAAAKNWGHS